MLAALYTDLIALLTPVEDRLVLRSYNITIAGREKVPHSPVIKLRGLMARENAAGKVCFARRELCLVDFVFGIR